MPDMIRTGYFRPPAGVRSIQPASLLGDTRIPKGRVCIYATKPVSLALRLVIQIPGDLID